MRIDDEQDPSQRRRLLDGILNEMTDGLGDTPFGSIAEANRRLQEVTSAYNARPQAELGGLSPDQVHQLLSADWESPTSAVRLRTDCTIDELADAEMLHDARLVLAMLDERKTVRATPKGNLPREFLQEFRTRRAKHVPADADVSPFTPHNEQDFGPLHYARVLLDVAGAIKRRQGRFSLTAHGAAASSAQQVGPLYAQLVRTCFRRVNLAYVGGWQEAPALQHTMSVTLFLLSRAPATWTPMDALFRTSVMPSVQEQLPRHVMFDMPPLLFRSHVIRPLEFFGLCASRSFAFAKDMTRREDDVRVTPLLNRLFEFRLRS